MKNSLPQVGFDCDRTCPAYESRDLCRFNALLSAIGIRAVVTSHTVSVKIEFRHLPGLASAVETMGGQVLGNGTHQLCSSTATGFGFRLPGWRLPLVAQDDGTLAYDDYQGYWGNVADLERLKIEYATGAAVIAANQLGWMNERQSDGSVLIYHPNGGTLTVDLEGRVEANGFHGVGCHEAATLIARSMGEPTQYVAKPEFFETTQQVNTQDNS